MVHSESKAVFTANKQQGKITISSHVLGCQAITRFWQQKMQNGHFAESLLLFPNCVYETLG